MGTINSRFVHIFLGSLLLASTHSFGKDPTFDSWDVTRTTNDLEIDTVHRLSGQQRYEDAIELCESVKSRYSESSLKAAKWAVEHSRVLVAKYCESKIFDDANLPVVMEPVTALLESYPDHPWRFFLEAQVHEAQKKVVLHLVARSAISPFDRQVKESAIRFSVQVSGAVTGLIEEISRFRSQLNKQGELFNVPSLDELYRLQQTLMVDVVSLALLQSDLMDLDSDDFIAAASRAEKLAIEATAVLPVGTIARIEVIRLRIESLIRMRQFETAEDLLKKTVLPPAFSGSPKWYALRTRLRIAQGRELAARDELTNFYKVPLESMILDKSPDRGDFVPTDLALLQFFVKYGTIKRVTDCLAWIEKRGGRYARLRADAIALGQLLPGEDREGLRKNPELIAARGQQLTRSGDLEEAAELFALASDLSTSPVEAIQFAVQAASLFGQIKNPKRAGEVLRITALRHSKVQQAPAAHLQATILLSQVASTDRVDIQSDLLEHLGLWPRMQTARSVRLWLYDLFRSNRQLLKAAEVVTAFDLDHVQEPDARLIAGAWHDVIKEKAVDWKLVSNTFYQEFQSRQIHPSLRLVFQKLSLILLESDTLMNVDTKGFTEFEHSVYQLRTGKQNAQSMPDPSEDWLQDDWIKNLSLRLLADAKRNRNLRRPVSQSLLNWPSVNLSVPEEAQCLIWGQQLNSAIQKLEQWVKDSPSSLDRMKAAAELLQSCEEKIAVSKAAEYWGAIAAGIPKGTEQWHQAKLSRIQSLRKSGDEDGAKKLANYLLLTAPGLSDFWRARYREQI